MNAAIRAGFRHIDGAAHYYNERVVGQGIKSVLDENVVKREDLFVTSKVVFQQTNPYILSIIHNEISVINSFIVTLVRYSMPNIEYKCTVGSRRHYLTISD